MSKPEGAGRSGGERGSSVSAPEGSDARADLDAMLAEADQILAAADRALLAEAYRGTPADAAVDRVLGHGIRPITMGHAMARLAGRLRHRDRLDSCHTVDAFVVAAAVRLGGRIVVTGDPADLRSLAREHPNVKIEPLAAST
jgi:hypothetical protein